MAALRVSPKFPNMAARHAFPKGARSDPGELHSCTGDVKAGPTSTTDVVVVVSVVVSRGPTPAETGPYFGAVAEPAGIAEGNFREHMARHAWPRVDQSGLSWAELSTKRFLHIQHGMQHSGPTVRAEQMFGGTGTGQLVDLARSWPHSLQSSPFKPEIRQENGSAWVVTDGLSGLAGLNRRANEGGQEVGLKRQVGRWLRPA